MAETPQSPPGDREQTFIEHLVELRARLLRSLLSVLLVFIALSFFANDLYTLLARPLMRLLPGDATMIATQVAAPFLAPFKLTLVLALFVALPYVLYQAWRFIAPGLYQHEQRLVLPLVVSSTALFYLGVAFAYFAVFPVLFGFFTKTAPEGIMVMTDINSYLDFVLSMFVAFGLIFEIPVATVLMVRAEVIAREELKQLRPYVIVGCFIVAALLTPPDVVSQCMLAVPMWLLFEAGVLASAIVTRKVAATAAPTIHPNESEMTRGS
ncbi:MAG: twin-arginine translocase subunit TatC [Chromatiales bacterium]